MQSNQKGQSLLEAVIAVTIIIVGVFGTVTLIIGSLKGSEVSEQELIAQNMAREGIEIVRSVRDSNWLAINSGQNVTWDAGLQGASADFTAIATLQNNAWTLNFAVNDFDQSCSGTYCTQMFQKDGVYTQFDGDKTGYTATPYKRFITIRPICRDDAGKEGIVNISGQSCANLAGELGNNIKKVGVEIESTVRYTAGTEITPYTLVERLYNWKPGVAD